jgi:hypothetical protein
MGKLQDNYLRRQLGSPMQQRRQFGPGHVIDGTTASFRGAWSSAASYNVGDEVTYNGNYWLAAALNTNSPPTTSNANWVLYGPVTLDNLNDGSTYLRMPGANMDPNRRGLIDFSQPAHVNLPLLQQAQSPISSPTQVNAALTSGTTTTANYNAGNTFTLPGIIEFEAYANGGIIDLLLWASNNSSGQPNGYFFRFDQRASYPAGQILIVTNGGWSNIGAQQQPVNSAALSGWHNVKARVSAGGRYDIFIDGVWQCTATDTTYSPTGATYLGYEVTSPMYVAPPGITTKTQDHIPQGETLSAVSLNYVGNNGVPLVVFGQRIIGLGANGSLSANTVLNVLTDNFLLPDDNNNYIIYVRYQLVFSSSNSTGGKYVAWLTDSIIGQPTAPQYAQTQDTGVWAISGAALFGILTGTGQTDTITLEFIGSQNGTVYASEALSTSPWPTLPTYIQAIALPVVGNLTAPSPLRLG